STDAVSEPGSDYQVATSGPENGQTVRTALTTIDSTHFSYAYSQGTDNDGYLTVLEVNTGTGGISEPGSKLEFETTFSEHISMAQISSYVHLLCYSDNNTDGIAKVVSVDNATWAITEEASLEFDTVQAEFISVAMIDSSYG